MKTLATLLIALSSTLALSAPAAAESFNDRGADFIATVPAGSQSSLGPVIARPSGFNEHSTYYDATVAPIDSNTMRQPVTAVIMSFNDRGDEVI